MLIFLGKGVQTLKHTSNEAKMTALAGPFSGLLSCLGIETVFFFFIIVRIWECLLPRITSPGFSVFCFEDLADVPVDPLFY